VLVSTVELFWRARRAGPLGLAGVAGVKLDWAALVARKKRLVESWSQGTKESLEKQGVAVLPGRAEFRAPNELAVDSRRVSAGRFVIATGSSPARPRMEGIERAVTSDEFFDLRAQPERLVVIGGGYIGMELGFAAARAGSQVTILQKGDEFLPALDAELRDILLTEGREAGMDFLAKADVHRIAAEGCSSVVEVSIEGRARRIAADTVLVATGRPPNTARLGLDRAGVKLAPQGGVVVNEFLAAPTAPHIYAAGDALGAPMHTPLAWYAGQLAAHNAVKGNERKADFSLLPTTVFTIPSVAQVGLTEAEARRKGITVAVKRLPMKHNPVAGIREETEGMVKAVYEEASDRLVGVQMLGAGAEDLIHIAAVALRAGLRRGDLAGMHYVFPTLAGVMFDVMA
jgi:pyruvate/2-oxoglutarate dehydrogenase complex dihydrolipoamide dehydrogenase (E3) component